MKTNLLLYISVFVFAIKLTFAQTQTDYLIKDIDNQIGVCYKKIDSLKSEKEIYLLKHIRQELKKYGLPKTEKGEKIIFHKAYALVYDEDYEQAKWVAHIILPEIANGAIGRTNDFRPDSLIETGSAVEQDYFLKHEENGKMIYDGFGYDRGHLAPSADFRWSAQALSESYFYSNMSPQVPEFNRGAWAKLEGILRSYVIQNNVELFVVTGPVLTKDLPVVPRSINKVRVPKYFYKIAYDKTNGVAVAFLMPNEDIQYPVETYAVSIDSVEAVTGIDFFYNLPDSTENRIEAEKNYKPFMTGAAKNDVAPLKNLPKGAMNTIEAWGYINSKKKVKVCGTVVSTYKSKKGNIFINLDKSFPHQIFSITIWAKDVPNFSYQPEIELKNRKACFFGKIKEYKGTPSMYISSEKQIDFLDKP